jgi:hypothetical protein
MKIVNRNSGALLDNPTCGYEGADIRLGDRGGPCARWRIEDRGEGWASLNNQHSNKVAEAAGCATANGADVAQWGWLDNACQRFRFIATSDGFVRIENERSGRVLDAAGCGGAGANVQLWDWLGNACQQFRLEPAGRVLLLGADVRGCRGRCVWDFRHTELGYSTVIERRSGRALVERRGQLRLGRRWGRATQWSLTPRNDDSYTLANRAGGEYRVKVVLPNP